MSKLIIKNLAFVLALWAMPIMSKSNREPLEYKNFFHTIFYNYRFTAYKVAFFTELPIKKMVGKKRMPLQKTTHLSDEKIGWNPNPQKISEIKTIDKVDLPECNLNLKISNLEKLIKKEKRKKEKEKEKEEELVFSNLNYYYNEISLGFLHNSKQ